MSNEANISKLDKHEFVELIAGLELPRYEQIPNIDLYMDQLLTYIEGTLRPLVAPGEKLLTASMVNNYVKQGVIPAPHAKRYTADHVALLMAICLMKRVFSIGDIRSLLRISSATHKVSRSYNFFCQATEESLRQLFCGHTESELVGSWGIEPREGFAFSLLVKDADALSAERRLALSAATSVANKIYVEKCFELGILETSTMEGSE